MWLDLNTVLERGSGETIYCSFFNLPTLLSADIAIVVVHRPFYWPPFLSTNTYRRFKGESVDNWQWTEQPVADIKSEVDKAING